DTVELLRKRVEKINQEAIPVVWVGDRKIASGGMRESVIQVQPHHRVAGADRLRRRREPRLVYVNVVGSRRNLQSNQGEKTSKERQRESEKRFSHSKLVLQSRGVRQSSEVSPGSILTLPPRMRISLLPSLGIQIRCTSMRV